MAYVRRSTILAALRAARLVYVIICHCNVPTHLPEDISHTGARQSGMLCSVEAEVLIDRTLHLLRRAKFHYLDRLRAWSGVVMHVRGHGIEHVMLVARGACPWIALYIARKCGVRHVTYD